MAKGEGRVLFEHCLLRKESIISLHNICKLTNTRVAVDQSVTVLKGLGWDDKMVTTFFLAVTYPENALG